MLAVQPDAGALDEAGIARALRAAQAGDVAAFNTLVLVYQRQIFNVCYRTLGNGEDASDATQDALLSAFRALKTFQGAAPGLRGWLLRIAVNTCYDQLRRRQRRPADSLDAPTSQIDPDRDTSLGDHLPDPGMGPEQRSLTSETARHIQAALDQLPPDQRLTVILCDVQGLSYDEAAQTMAVELGTVKSRLSRARSQLRDVLAAKGELPAASQRLKERNP
jgi:RNA polymerase sigma-70 factor, ECF subfamily